MTKTTGTVTTQSHGDEDEEQDEATNEVGTGTESSDESPSEGADDEDNGNSDESYTIQYARPASLRGVEVGPENAVNQAAPEAPRSEPPDVKLTNARTKSGKTVTNVALGDLHLNHGGCRMVRRCRFGRCTMRRTCW